MAIISDIVTGGQHSLIRAIGKALGIYSHDEEITDLQISNLLTPGEAEKSARRTSKHASGGDAMIAFKGYRGFQRDYRKKYSAQFMNRQGYSPNSSASAKVVIKSKLKAYLQNAYGYCAVTLEEFGDKYLTLPEKGRHAVQQIVGYNYATGELLINDKVYGSHTYVELADLTKIQVTSVRNYNDTIMQNMMDNYAYDGTYVYVGQNRYTIGELKDIVNVNDQYETVCTNVPYLYADVTTTATIGGTACVVTYPDDVNNNGYVEDTEITDGIVHIHITLPGTAVLGGTLVVTINNVITNYTITQNMLDTGFTIDYAGYTLISTPTQPEFTVLTQVDRITNVVTNIAYAIEASYASYRVTSGEVGNETRYWVYPSEELDIYEYQIIDVTAIIPMKEDNVMVDIDGVKLKRMLRKLNLSGDQLRSSIENPDLDSAYLMMGVSPEYNDPITNEVLFRTFDYLSPGSGNIAVSINRLSMGYRFSMVKRTITGSIGTVGSYTRTETTTPNEDGYLGSSVVMTLRYQGNSAEYKELEISGFSQNYTVSGHGFTSYLDSTGGMCRIIIPLNLLNSLPYKKFVWVYERSLCMLAYSLEVVHVKWYETGAFGTLLKIVAAVITVWTLGAASSLYALIVAVAKAVVIGIVVSYIANMIGGIAGTVIGALVGMYLMGGFNLDLSSFTSSEVWLKFANDCINLMSQMQQHELETYVSKSQDEIEVLAKEVKEMQSKIEEADEGSISLKSFDSSYCGRINTLYQTTESYCGGLIDASVDSITDYGRQMEYAITTRSQVVSGIG